MVAVGLVVHGIAAYGFLAVAARRLGPEAYAPLGVLWSMVFLVGPGVFIPLEQELARAIAVRRAGGEGSGPVIDRAAVIGGIAAAVLLLATVALSDVLLRELLRDDVALLVAFGLGLVGYLLGHLTRGTMAGLGRFRAYATYLGGEGVVRFAACLVLAVIGVTEAGPYGLIVGIAPFVAVLAAVLPERRQGLRAPGPEAPWSELSAHLGALLLGSVLSLVLMNAGPVAVEVLADASEADKAGTFVAGLVIARIPFFLFQGIQGALLPKLASLAGAGRWDDFRTGLRRLLGVVAALGVVAVAGAALLGPFAVRTLFGDDFELGQRSMTMLAAAVSLYIVAMSLAQALIAMAAPGRMAAGWAAGVVTFATAMALGDDLLFRVELGLVAGAIGASVVMGGLLAGVLRDPPERGEQPLPPPEAFGVLADT